MQKQLETLFDHYPFLIHIILTLSQNKDQKISLESLELLKKGIISLSEKITALKSELSKKQVFLFEDDQQITDTTSINQLENLQNILNSKY